MGWGGGDSGGSIRMSDRWEPFDSQHMASRGRAMMRGHRQLVVVGVTEDWMEPMWGLH